MSHYPMTRKILQLTDEREQEVKENIKASILLISMRIIAAIMITVILLMATN